MCIRDRLGEHALEVAVELVAGFFLIDVESQERAEEITKAFSGPGETVELRPVMGGGGDVD